MAGRAVLPAHLSLNETGSRQSYVMMALNALEEFGARVTSEVRASKNNQVGMVPGFCKLLGRTISSVGLRA